MSRHMPSSRMQTLGCNGAPSLPLAPPSPAPTHPHPPKPAPHPPVCTLQRNYRTFLLFVYTSAVLCMYVFGVSLAMLFVKHNQLVAEAREAGRDTGGLWGKTLGQVSGGRGEPRGQGGAEGKVGAMRSHGVHAQGPGSV